MQAALRATNARLVAVLVAGLAAAALLAGCADADDRATPGGSESPTGAPASADPASPSADPASPSAGPRRLPVSPSKTPGAGQLTITGAVVQGVEPGCMLLQTGDNLYLLLGGDRSLIQRSARLTVVGTPQPGLMTTCQQGTPFQVAEARPA